MKNLANILLLCLAVLAFGCSKPILTPTANFAAESPQATREDMREAIIQACAGRGWNITKADDSHVYASIAPRTHRAEIDIAYSESSVVINYVSSSNLEYKAGKDGETPTIHRAYNRWVNNLIHDIRNNLMAKKFIQN